MAKKRAPRTFGNAYLILDPQEVVVPRLPRTVKQHAMDGFLYDRFLHDSPGAQSWDHFYRAGYRCVKVLMTEVKK